MWVKDASDGSLIGIIGVHVDDFLLGGDNQHPEWQAALETFKHAFEWSPWEEPPFVHCGVSITQLPDFSFEMCQADYCLELKQIDVDDKSPEITPGEMTQARALLGAIQWRVQQTAPHHGAKLSWLQSPFPRGGKDVLVAINKLCREVYNHRYASVGVQNLQPDSLKEIVFIGWSDAAVGNRPDMTSTAKHIIGMTNAQMLQGVRSPVNLVSWKSGKLQRIARSSLSAEIQALSEAEQELMTCRLQWSEMLGNIPNLRRPWEIAAMIPGALVIDAKSVYDAVGKGETASALYSMKEKYAALELMAVVEALTATNTPLLWVSSEAQLADGMTKAQAQDSIRSFLQNRQLWTVKYEPMFVAAKKKRKLQGHECTALPDAATSTFEDSFWGM